MANEIYFFGKWDDKFDKNLTKPDYFYAINKEKSEIDFMNKMEFIKYYEDNDIQVIAKPYKGNDKSLCILLPKDRYNLTDLEKSFDNSKLETILNNMNYVQVKLSIPKLKLETSYSLEKPLEKLGLKKAFTHNADFSGISSEDPLAINKVTHKAFLQIDEEKTEAVAATIIGMQIRGLTPMPEPKVFKADHPFAFMIIDNKTKGIIFIGRYAKPEKFTVANN